MSHQNSYYQHMDDVCGEQTKSDSSSPSNGFAIPQGSIQIEHSSSRHQHPVHVGSSNQSLEYLSSANRLPDNLSQKSPTNQHPPKINNVMLANQKAPYSHSNDMMQQSAATQADGQSANPSYWSSHSRHHAPAPLPGNHSLSRDSQLLAEVSRQMCLQSTQNPSDIQTANQQTFLPIASNQNQSAYGNQLQGFHHGTPAQQFVQPSGVMSETTANAYSCSNTKQTLKDRELYEAAVLTEKLINRDKQNERDLAEFGQLLAELKKLD